jgi:uncharacterized membrane protein YkvA (DUF1232 family)
MLSLLIAAGILVVVLLAVLATVRAFLRSIVRPPEPGNQDLQSCATWESPVSKGQPRAFSRLFVRLVEWSRRFKRDVIALYLAARDPRVPWYAKAVAIAVAAYVLSPIDLIPDFIPVLGYLDDLIIVPLGIWVAVRLIPPEIMSEHRTAAASIGQRPSSMAGAAVIVAIWTVAAGALVWFALPAWGFAWAPEVEIESVMPTVIVLSTAAIVGLFVQLVKREHGAAWGLLTLLFTLLLWFYLDD